MHKIAVILWLYHTDLWQEIHQDLLSIKNNIHLYIGLCNSNDNNQIMSDLNEYPEYSLSFHDNLGLDVLPFVRQICDIDPNKHPLFIKVHGKKSLWGHSKHVPWRLLLFDSLIGNNNILQNNIRLLNNNNAGMLCNGNFILSHREHTNSFKIYEICTKLGINYQNIRNSDFSAGNMFMSYTAIFQKYLSPFKEYLVNKLASEPGRICDAQEGKYAHALERIFGYIIKNEGKKIYPAFQKTMIIYNNIAPNNKFHLCRIKNHCYILEDANIYGNVIFEGSNILTIQWLHLPNKPIQQYKQLNQNSLVKI
jgi:lipopolysaccharide biosynthesis protein